MRPKEYVLNCNVCKDITTFNVYSYDTKFPISITIDTEDITKIAKFKWYYIEGENIPLVGNFYDTVIKLGHVLLGTTCGAKIGHKNGNIFDYRKSNLKLYE